MSLARDPNNQKFAHRPGTKQHGSSSLYDGDGAAGDDPVAVDLATCPHCNKSVQGDALERHLKIYHPANLIRAHEVDGELPLSLIRVDGGTQPRALIDEQVVIDYAEALSNGAKFERIVVFYDGSRYWLADGFHRVEAARKAHLPALPADVRQGTQRDAILYSVGANATHGLRRTNADKRRAVERLLRDEEWTQWSNRQIAKRCNVTHTFVNNIRLSLETVSSDNGATPTTERTYTTKHGTTATMQTGNIGLKPAVPADAPTFIKDAVEEGQLGRGAAVKLTEALRSAPRPVGEVVAAQGVEDVDTVTELKRLWKDAPDTFSEIAASGYIQPGEGHEAVAITAGFKAVSEALKTKQKARAKIAAEEKQQAAYERALALTDVFQVWYADPPWQYDNAGLNGAAAQHYPPLPTEEIGELPGKLKLATPDNGVLFLWSTAPMLPDAMAVMDAWGFKYVTKAPWYKGNPTFGKLGFWGYSAVEDLLIGVRGNLRPVATPLLYIDEPKTSHSRKPAGGYSLIELMFPGMRYLELFARKAAQREGWTFWGDEADASA